MTFLGLILCEHVQNKLRLAQKRIFGFEILPAPFVVAHMQVVTLLADQGIPLEAQQRVGIYLTNSLTGWNREEVEQLAMPDFPALNCKLAHGEKFRFDWSVHPEKHRLLSD